MEVHLFVLDLGLPQYLSVWSSCLLFFHLGFGKWQSGEMLIWNVCTKPLIALSQWEAVINFNPLNVQMQIQKSKLIYFAGITKGLWNRKLRAQ